MPVSSRQHTLNSRFTHQLVNTPHSGFDNCIEPEFLANHGWGLLSPGFPGCIGSSSRFKLLCSCSRLVPSSARLLRAAMLALKARHFECEARSSLHHELTIRWQLWAAKLVTEACIASSRDAIQRLLLLLAATLTISDSPPRFYFITSIARVCSALPQDTTCRLHIARMTSEYGSPPDPRAGSTQSLDLRAACPPRNAMFSARLRRACSVSLVFLASKSSLSIGDDAQLHVSNLGLHLAKGCNTRVSYVALRRCLVRKPDASRVA